MEIPGSVPKWLFAGAWTAGVGTAIIARYALGDDRAPSRLTRHWAHGIARACGLSVEVFGKDSVDWDRTYVIMPNHLSPVDILALIETLPFVPGFLAKKELRTIPVLGKAMESAGHVFIDRANRSDAVRALDEAADRVRSGRSIVVFPEGTRGDGHCLRPFKKGGFHLARRAGVGLLPIGLRGTADVLGRHGSQIRSGRAEVHIGIPIPPEELAELSLEQLMLRTNAAISELSGIPASARPSAPSEPPSA